MASELCMNCFSVKGKAEVCPYCGYEEKTPPAQPHYLMPGTMLANHFIVGTAIGAGNFGITYKCYDVTLGVIVAVKEFYPIGLVNRASGESKVSFLSGSSQDRYQKQMARFLMEAQSIAKFGKTKDIVNVYDYFEENNTAYIIMEYIDGVLLQDYLEQKGRLDVAEAKRIIDQVIEAVKKIHAQGIIHRDISPDNIILLGKDSIKIFDFGAAILGDSQQGLAAEKIVKAGYSAPEQYRDPAGQGYYTDIYSIGALFYRMLTGKKPPEATQREYKDKMKSPLKLGVSIEPNLDRAVMEAMAVDPKYRFQGIVPLEEAFHGQRIACYPEDKIRRKKRRRNWTVAITTLLIVAAGVGVALFNTMFQTSNEMFEQDVPAGEKLVIWVDSKDMKQMLEQVVGDMGKGGEGESENLEKIRQQSCLGEYCIVDITEPDGGVEGYSCSGVEFGEELTMDAALQAVKGTEEFPDIFLSDHVSDLNQYTLLSFKDTVYQAIDSDNYLYLSQYSRYFPDMLEMPTSFDTILFYAFGTDSESENTVWSSTAMQKKLAKHLTASSLLGQQNEDGTLPLKMILEANTAGTESTYTQNQVAARMAILESPESFNVETGQFQFQQEYYDVLAQLLGNTANAMSPAYTWTQTEAEDSTKMYGTSVLAGVGYRASLYDAKIGNSQIPYDVYVPTVNGKMLVEFTGKLAVSDGNGQTVDRAKQIAALRFVYFALGQQYYVGNSTTGYPLSDAILKKSDGETDTSNFREYFEGNPLQKSFCSLVTETHYPCILIGEGAENIDQFAAGLPQDSGKEAIEQYCTGYDNGQSGK